MQAQGCWYQPVHIHKALICLGHTLAPWGGGGLCILCREIAAHMGTSRCGSAAGRAKSVSAHAAGRR